jgi:Adenylate and Guanylate cyclase catalytic domain
VDSTAFAGQLGPEKWREAVQAYQAACAEVVQYYDGHIAQYLGDGLLVYFGYPRAHEDDVRRAIYTGLGMVEAVGTLNAQLDQNKGIRLPVRAERAIAIRTEQGFASYLAWAIIIQGWTRSGQGQIEEDITQMRQGLAALRATGAELRRPYYLELLAEVYGRVGQAEKGLHLLDEAVGLVHKTGEGWREAELSGEKRSYIDSRES